MFTQQSRQELLSADLFRTYQFDCACDSKQIQISAFVVEINFAGISNMEEQRDNKPSTIVEIAADGDVILVVGPEKMKLRVHSLFLKAASKPFSAMFGPDWKEGHTMLGRDGPVEVPLPDDNAAVLKVICAVIHHENEKVPQTLAARDVLEIALTADKYDCVGALKFASGNWLQPLENETHDLMLLTAASYIFQNAQSFKEITKALILSHSGPYLALSCEEVESTMTWRVFCKYFNDQFGHLEYVTDWLMHRSARRTKKPCKAETSRNTNSRNKRRDWDLCSPVWMVKQISISLFKFARKGEPLANALALHL
jgi:hypothetical protein